MAIEIAQNLDAVNMIRAQQGVVGRSIIGGAGAVGGGNLIGQGEQTDILASIQLLSEKTFKAIKQQTDTLVKILEFDKKKDRREKEQRAEDKKEAKTDKGLVGPQRPTSFKDQDIQNKEKGFSILEFFAASSLAKSLTKIFAPIRKFIGVIAASKLGGLFTRLGPLFAGAGPLALIAGALFVLFKYSKEIAAALSPAVEGLKQAFDYLKPVFDIILGIGDVIIKTGIFAIGTSLTLAFETLALVIGTLVSSVEFVYNLLKGIVTGDMNLIANAWIKVKSTFASLGDRFINAIKSLYNGIIDALPLPDKIKNKIKLNIDEKAQQQADVGNVGAATNIKEMAKERPEFIGSDGKKQLTFGEAPSKDKSTPDSKKSLFTSGGAYTIEEPKEETKSEIIPEEKPKTINMDQTPSATQVAEKISGDPNLPPLGMNMYNTTGESWEERADQWRNFKAALLQAEKDGSISKEELDFRVMKMKDEKDRLQRAKRLIGIKKQRAELRGETFNEAAILGQLDADNAAIQERVLAEEGMTVQSFDEALNNKLKPNVNKRNLLDDTGKGSGGNVITDAKQTFVTNSNTTRQDTYVGGINTSSGDNYFDRQTGSYAT